MHEQFGGMHVLGLDWGLGRLTTSDEGEREWCQTSRFWCR
jgi:hypothetical protein